jgi:hypothetical protein
LTCLAVAAIAAGTAEARRSYCSPSGDYCTSTARLGGAVFLRVGTFSFRGRVRICVTAPTGNRECRSFLLRRAQGGIYEAKVRWHRHYPNGGAGTYRVRFFTGTTLLGPVLTFRLR